MMDLQTSKKYNYWQWRTLIVLMIGYALFYFCRKNFSIAMPALENELGLKKSQLGFFLMLNGVIYGISRFINGILADRFSRKLLMAIGLLASAIVNIVLGFIPQMDGLFGFLDAEGKATTGLIVFIGSLWLINGYIQGMGYPPCASLMAHWIKPSELATKQSIWNSSHSIGAGLVAMLIGFILGHYGNHAWQWCFFIPALLALFGAFLVFFGLKDTPASVGLPDPSDMELGSTSSKPAAEGSKGANHPGLVTEMVYKNPVIWILALGNFCIYVIRFTILDWGSTFLTQFKGMDINTAANVVAASEIAGGIVGTLVAGWFTDKFFKSKAHRTCVICAVGATISFFLFWKSPSSSMALSIIFLILSSFFIYGPQALLGIAASNQATKSAAATANGILGIFGYISPVVSAWLFGLLADTRGWDSVFFVAIIFGVLSIAVLAVLWNIPADGYAKASRFIEKQNDKQ